MLIGMCGVGGTGKTTAVNELLKLIPDLAFQPSIVRRFYELRGVKSEVEYFRTMREDERLDFQVDLLDYYMRTTVEFVEAHPGQDVILDRTAFDHVAYAVYSNPSMSLGRLYSIMAYAEHFGKLDPLVFRFPYPVPWTGTAAAEDGFRKTDVGKNWLVDCAMQRVTRTYAPDAVLVPMGLPAERAAAMAEVINQRRGAHI